MLVCAFLCAIGTRDRGCSVHPAFPAPSVSRVRQKNLHHSGEITPRDRETVFAERRRATPSLVIARLDRATSIPETPMIQSRSRGVLDTPPSRGMTTCD